MPKLKQWHCACVYEREIRLWIYICHFHCYFQYLTSFILLFCVVFAISIWWSLRNPLFAILTCVGVSPPYPTTVPKVFSLISLHRNDGGWHECPSKGDTMHIYLYIFIFYLSHIFYFTFTSFILCLTFELLRWLFFIFLFSIQIIFFTASYRRLFVHSSARPVCV